MPAYLVSENTAQWIKDEMARQGEGSRRQYLPRFTSKGGGGGSAKILKIISGDPLQGFSVAVYNNYSAYLSDDSSGTGLYYPLEIGMGGAIPPGTLVVGHPFNVQITGGS